MSDSAVELTTETAVSEPEQLDAAIKKCSVVVSEQICIQADVKIDPKVEVEEIKIFCGDPFIGKCGRVSCTHEPCEFTVSETICVQIPLVFSAETKVHPSGHICGAPEMEPCPHCQPKV